ncbi:MAG TPA: UDP-N-acetylmuramoyl-L-alanine--D-glutamate ligase [Oscillatoriales cyanobacterium M4454_W2019_049]|nr:UDP-N-acetylmuramoyl-L-alanine--D-glutamate ligase [Oscillatoriales cyanobacterium M4454_W2019_049]
MANAEIIGLGRSGIAAAKLLQRQGWQVTLSDRSSSDSLRQQQQQLQKAGISVRLGDTFTPSPELQLVVVSPGVPWDLPNLQRAREMGIETIGEMELAWRNLKQIPWVGITGTNGKTTTTALIAAIFQAAGFNAPACGNIGYAACELALQGAESLDWVIAEISSYQIESSSTLTPRIGVWTTFTPDHLSRHYTLENYFNIKAKLLDAAELPVFNGDDSYLFANARHRWNQACWTSAKAHLTDPDFRPQVYIEDGWVVEKGARILPADALKMPGDHNQQNLLMAVATARLAGIETEAIDRAITNFPGVPHRLERISTWQGIDFINDSKATNYDAAQVGLAAVASPAILIAGGEAKEGDDTAWLQTIQDKAVAVLLIGEAAPQFADRLKEVGYTAYEIVETMDKAIDRSRELAPAKGAAVVLLSPACASFDQYPNFEARGDHFRQLCPR